MSRIWLILIWISIYGFQVGYGELLGHWPLNKKEPTGDASGRGSAATLNGVVNYKASNTDDLMSTKGSDLSAGGDVTISNPDDDVTVSGDFSVLFYMLPAFPTTGTEELFGWDASYPGNTRGVHVTITGAGDNVTLDMTLYDNVTGTQEGPGVHQATVTLTGEYDWIRVAITYQLADGKSVIWLNDEEYINTGTVLTSLDALGDLFIGKVTSVPTNPYTGGITCFQLHNEALDMRVFDWDGTMATCFFCDPLLTAVYMDGFCYQINLPQSAPEEKSWDDAATECSGRAGHTCGLATIFTQRQQDILERWIYDAKVPGGVEDMDFWIGLRRNTPPDPYTWQQYDSDYINWMAGLNADEPTMLDGELCVALMHSPDRAIVDNVTGLATFGWSDEDCSLTKGYICQCQHEKSTCDKSLIKGIYPATAIWASSDVTSEETNRSSIEGAVLGSRVGLISDFGAWSTEDLHSLEYFIQVEKDTGPPWLVREVWTQGHAGDPEWVRSYYLHYSMDGAAWTSYSEIGHGTTPKLFIGNRNQHEIRRNKLDNPFLARYVRVTPIGYKHGMQRYSMRLELIGCREFDIDHGDSSLIHYHTQIYGLDNYNDNKKNNILTGLTKFWDEDLGNCGTIPSYLHHTALHYLLQWEIIQKKRVIVKLWGVRLPCKQAFHPNAPGHSVLSTPHHMDTSPTAPPSFLETSHRECTLLKEEGSKYSATTRSCTFYCEGSSFDDADKMHMTRHIQLSLEKAPDYPTDPEWALCEIATYGLD